MDGRLILVQEDSHKQGRDEADKKGSGKKKGSNKGGGGGSRALATTDAAAPTSGKKPERGLGGAPEPPPGAKDWTKLQPYKGTLQLVQELQWVQAIKQAEVVLKKAQPSCYVCAVAWNTMVRLLLLLLLAVVLLLMLP